MNLGVTSYQCVESALAFNCRSNKKGGVSLSALLADPLGQRKAPHRHEGRRRAGRAPAGPSGGRASGSAGPGIPVCQDGRAPPASNR